MTALRFRRSKATNHGGLGLIEIWKAQSYFRPSVPSVFRFSFHVQPPPRRLHMKMVIVHLLGAEWRLYRNWAIPKRWATTRDQSVPGLFSKHLSNQLERIQHMDKQSAVRKKAVAFTETETEGTSNHTRLDHTSHLTKSSNLFAIFDHLRVRCGGACHMSEAYSLRRWLR